MRGGERVLDALCELFPQADLYTLIHVRGSVSPRIEGRRVVASPLSKLPRVGRHYRALLPLFPLVLSTLRPRGYDLVISSSHCVAKGVTTGGTPHLSYCHTPMRYIWDGFEDYFGPGRPALQRIAGRLLRARLRRWDVRSNERVDRFIANSHHVAERIARHYGRKARVVYPPVDVERFRIATGPGDAYLIVSALVPYKRIDLALEAFRLRPGRLLIAGTGPEEGKLRRLAPPGVTFLGRVSDAEVAELLSRARALILPGREDFGITPLEAMASGRPVVALAEGGAVETVIDPRSAGGRAPTGILFERASPEALAAALDDLERNLDLFDPQALRAHAERFSRPRFIREMAREAEDLLRERRPA